MNIEVTNDFSKTINTKTDTVQKDEWRAMRHKAKQLKWQNRGAMRVRTSYERKHEEQKAYRKDGTRAPRSFNLTPHEHFKQSNGSPIMLIAGQAHPQVDGFVRQKHVSKKLRRFTMSGSRFSPNDHKRHKHGVKKPDCVHCYPELSLEV